MVYYTDDIERMVMSLYNNKFRYGNRLKVISEYINIDSDDIAEVILSISLDIIKHNELKFKKSIFYPNSPDDFFISYFQSCFNAELKNLSNYVNDTAAVIVRSNINFTGGRSFGPSFNIEKVNYILKIAKRNTLLRELIN